MKWYSSWQKKERFLITLWSALRSFSCVSHMDQYMWFLLKRFPRAAIEWIRTCFMLCTRYCSCSTHVAMRVPSIDVLLPLFCYAVATLLIYCCHSIDTLLPLYWYAVATLLIRCCQSHLRCCHSPLRCCHSPLHIRMCSCVSIRSARKVWCR